MKAWLAYWQDPPRSLNIFPIEAMLFLALGRPKVNMNRDFQSFNRLIYFYGGHVSNDVIIFAIVKPQGMVNLSEA